MRATKQRSNVAGCSSRTAVDLFAGAGGATQGLKQAKFDVLAAVENDPTAAATFRTNHESTVLFEQDIRSITVDDVRGCLPPQTPLDLLKACPPCQGFSSLGKGDRADERNDLVTELWRFVDGLRPRAFVFENVPALATDDRLTDLLDRASRGGYGVRRFVVDAADFGVPQRRRRLIVIGVQGLDSNSIADDIATLLPGDFDRSPQAAGPAIARAGSIASSNDALHRARRPTPIVRQRLAAIPVGGDRFDLPAELQLPCHSKVGRVATAAYGRILADEPAPTLTTRCTTPACGRFVHPTEPRGLSLREAALLQTFPLDYQFSGGHDRVERQIGNAVPVRLAQALGLAAHTLLDLTALDGQR